MSPGSDKREMRTETVLVRMTPSERKRLTVLAALTGETQSELLRSGAVETGCRRVAEMMVDVCVEEILSGVKTAGSDDMLV